jgi:hypothetical protein
LEKSPNVLGGESPHNLERPAQELKRNAARISGKPAQRTYFVFIQYSSSFEYLSPSNGRFVTIEKMIRASIIPRLRVLEELHPAGS